MKATRQIMGMPITIEVVGDGPDLEQAMNAAFDYLVWVDETFSTYKAASEISRINDGELVEAHASETVREVLAACVEMRGRTDGYFDIHRQNGRIDPSGYVKGWAVRGAADKLAEAGRRNYFVEAGGDLQARGHNAEGGPWRVGIRNPFNKREIVKVLGITDGGVATSGTYERGDHIYNPHTGRAATELASMTVVGPDITVADVFATAAFAMGLKGAGWVATQGLECYAIAPDGSATFTPGLRKYLD